MNWRTIITDTESLTGVAPVCEDPKHEAAAIVCGLEPGEAGALGTGPLVLDCCPHPHLELWGEAQAEHVRAFFNANEAGMAGA